MGFSGPAQLNGIIRIHVKAPLAAADGHEWSRSTAVKSDVFDFGKGQTTTQTTTPGKPCLVPLYSKEVFFCLPTLFGFPLSSETNINLFLSVFTQALIGG